MVQTDYRSLTLINSDGRSVGVMNVHRNKVGDKILEWLDQQAGGEVLVKAHVIDFNTNVRVDP